MTDEIIRTLLPFLREHGHERLYKRGATIIRMGDPVDRFMVVLHGRAKLSVKSGESRELLLCFTRRNETLGDLEFFSPGLSTVTAITVTECHTLYMDMDAFRKMASISRKLLKVLGNSVAFKLRRANSKNLVNIMYPLKERLASYIFGQVSGTSRDDLRGDSLMDIAELLGTSYRHLNRVISRLCEEKVLKRTKWGLTVSDREKLEELARDIYLY